MEQAAKQINDIISQPDAEKSFLDLIQTLNSNTGSMTSGQMIIMAMNSLLENVDNALKATNFEQDHLIQGNIYISSFEPLRGIFIRLNELFRVSN